MKSHGQSAGCEGQTKPKMATLGTQVNLSTVSACHIHMTCMSHMFVCVLTALSLHQSEGLEVGRLEARD